jgi:hypothetical protein
VRTTLVTLLSLLVALAAFPQTDKQAAEMKAMWEAMEKASAPGDEHRMLNPMIGTFDTVLRFYAAPGAPPSESTGVSDSRWILGGRYVEQRFKGTSMGQPFEGLGYTAYDKMKKQYVSTWMDSMSTGIMTSTGSALEGGKSWKFTGTMDDPMSGTSTKTEQTINVVSNDKHVFEMWAPGPDGKSFKMMEIVYTRKK